RLGVSMSSAQLSELRLMLIVPQASTRLHRAVLDAIAQVEHQAWSAWRYSEQSGDPSQDIGKAISAAVDLGAANRAREDATEGILADLFDVTDPAIARNAVLKTSEFETALLEVRACVLI